MESILFIISNIAFYAVIYFNLIKFNFLANLDAAWILLIFSLMLTLPSTLLFYIIKKDRKKYFIFSSIWTILLSVILFFFGNNILTFFGIKSGLANYTIYLYKYLFMFSSLLSIYFVSIYKIMEQKKQLFFLIALKFVLPIILNLIFINILEFTKILWLFAITDLFTTIFAFIFVSRKN